MKIELRYAVHPEDLFVFEGELRTNPRWILPTRLQRLIIHYKNKLDFNFCKFEQPITMK